MLHIPPTKESTHLLTAQKTENKTRATQKSLPFRKWRFREKEVRRMSPKQKMIRQKEQQDYKKEQKKKRKKGKRTEKKKATGQGRRTKDEI